MGRRSQLGGGGVPPDRCRVTRLNVCNQSPSHGGASRHVHRAAEHVHRAADASVHSLGSVLVLGGRGRDVSVL